MLFSMTNTLESGNCRKVLFIPGRIYWLSVFSIKPSECAWSELTQSVGFWVISNISLWCWVMYCQPRKFFCCCQSAVNVFTYSVGVKEITKSCSFKRQPLIPDPWKKFCEGHASKKVSGLISLMRDINSVPLFLSPEFVVISWRTPTGASDDTCPRNFAAEGTHIIRSFVMSDTRYNILKWQLIRSWMANRGW